MVQIKIQTVLFSYLSVLSDSYRLLVGLFS